MSNTSTFPAALDSFTNPASTDTTLAVSLSAGQTKQNDSLANIETLLGITNSSVSTSLTYKVNNLVNAVQVLLSDSGSANAYAVAPSPAITAYAAGQQFAFNPANTNTGASTLNVNSLGTKTIQYNGSALIGNNLTASVAATVIYDGTNFQLLNPVFGPYITWTSTLSGFSQTSVYYYQQIGKKTSVYNTVSAPGTSTATAHTLTLPMNAKNVEYFMIPQYEDNGSVSSSFGVAATTAGSNILNLYTNGAAAGWTASGNSFVKFSFTYESQ